MQIMTVIGKWGRFGLRRDLRQQNKSACGGRRLPNVELERADTAAMMRTIGKNTVKYVCLSVDSEQ